MHDREKSDSAIVAEKPTNKAGRPDAESVEPRAEAEGNAGQHRTCRAQDRESVSQSLDRVREAARQRKKERFTTLLHHVSHEALRLAFFAGKRHFTSKLSSSLSLHSATREYPSFIPWAQAPSCPDTSPECAASPSTSCAQTAQPTSPGNFTSMPSTHFTRWHTRRRD